MSRPRLRLFLVRHGQVAANREYRFVGAADHELSDLGEAEARALGASFEDVELDLVLSSPLRRTLETARRIRSDVEVADGLVEQRYGDWEGLTRDEVLELGADHAELLRRCGESTDLAPPGGESLDAVATRVRGVIDDLERRDVRRALLVTHVGPIKSVLAQALGLSLLAVRPMFLDTGTITVVDWGDPSLLRLFNCRGGPTWTSARWMQQA